MKLFLYEWKKLLFYQKGWLVILVALGLRLCAWVLTDAPAYAQIELYRDAYLDSIEGVEGKLNEEKTAAIESDAARTAAAEDELKQTYLELYAGTISEAECGEKVRELSALADRYRGMNALYEQYLYARQDAENRYLLYPNGWAALLRTGTPDFILLGALFWLIVPLYCRDYGCGMDVLIRTTAEGSRHYARSKFSAALLLAILLRLLFCMAHLGFCAVKYGLTHADYPLQSLEAYADTTGAVSLGGAFLRLTLQRLSGTVLLAALLCLAAAWTRRYAAPCFLLLCVVLFFWLVGITTLAGCGTDNGAETPDVPYNTVSPALSAEDVIVVRSPFQTDDTIGSCIYSAGERVYYLSFNTEDDSNIRLSELSARTTLRVLALESDTLAEDCVFEVSYDKGSAWDFLNIVTDFFLNDRAIWFVTQDGVWQVDRLTRQRELLDIPVHGNLAFDGTGITFIDETMRLAWYDAETGERTLIDDIVAEKFVLTEQGIYFSNLRDDSALYFCAADGSAVQKNGRGKGNLAYAGRRAGDVLCHGGGRAAHHHSNRNGMKERESDFHGDRMSERIQKLQGEKGVNQFYNGVPTGRLRSAGRERSRENDAHQYSGGDLKKQRGRDPGGRRSRAEAGRAVSEKDRLSAAVSAVLPEFHGAGFPRLCMRAQGDPGGGGQKARVGALGGGEPLGCRGKEDRRALRRDAPARRHRAGAAGRPGAADSRRAHRGLRPAGADPFPQFSQPVFREPDRAPGDAYRFRCGRDRKRGADFEGRGFIKAGHAGGAGSGLGR